MKVKKPTIVELSNNSTIVKSSILLVLLLTVSMFLGAQKAGPDVVLGTAQDFSKMIGDHVNKTQSNNKYSNVLSEQSNQITLKTPTGEFTGVVNLAHTLGSSDQIVGAGEKSGSEFELHSEADGTVSGLYTSVSDNVAYEYYTDSTNSTVRVKEVDISSVLCVEYNMVADSSVLNSATDANQRRRLIQPIFESLPNSKFVAYLDFDGEVYQGNWDGGQVINAQPINYSDKDIETIWEYVREDFAPFGINITTSRAVYDATPTSNKMMVIITSTNWRGSGGVAYVNSFGTNTVCWAFNSSISACSITISHELGHTMGLDHKGDPSTAYYAGHSDWGPIMGV